MKKALLLFVFSSVALLASQKKNDNLWRYYSEILPQVVIENYYSSTDGRFFHNGVNYAKLRSSSQLKNLLEKQKNLLKTAKIPSQKNARLAFLMNAYNFFTLVDVAYHPKKKSMKKIGWKNKHHDIGGKKYSLDFIEHGLIRKIPEPRIHFAINCASVGCPSLAKEIFTAKDVDKQLTFLTKNALRNPLHLYTHKGWRGEKVYSTSLLSWFSNDFKVQPYGSRLGFIKAFAPSRYAKYDSLSPSINYDWDFNNQKNITAKIEALAKEHKALNIRKRNK